MRSRLWQLADSINYDTKSSQVYMTVKLYVRILSDKLGCMTVIHIQLTFMSKLRTSTRYRGGHIEYTPYIIAFVH